MADFLIFDGPSTADALSPDAFQAPEFFTYPPPAWWREHNPPDDDLPDAPRFPTRAKYWTAYPLARLRSPTPLRGESRARAASRAAKARSYTGRLQAYSQRVVSVRWRLRLESVVETVASRASGSVEVWRGETVTPFQSLARGARVSPFDIDALYYELARATVRSTTGISKGPSGGRVDGRNGPAWGARGVNAGLREALNAAGITYENSVCFVDRVTLEIDG